MSREVTRSQREWLEGEIAVWQTMGLVDEERARALLWTVRIAAIVRGTPAIPGTAHFARLGGDPRGARGAAA